MPALRINLRKFKDALRLKFEGALSHQQLASILGISKVGQMVWRALALRRSASQIYGMIGFSE